VSKIERKRTLEVKYKSSKLTSGGLKQIYKLWLNTTSLAEVINFVRPTFAVFFACVYHITW